MFAVLLAAFVFLLVEGLGSSLNFFDTVDQAFAHRGTLGTRTFNLEGDVVAGSIHPTAVGTDFDIAEGYNTVAVTNTGSPPQLFQAKIAVVVVGHFTSRRLARLRLTPDTGEALGELLRRQPEPSEVARAGPRLVLNASLGTDRRLAGLRRQHRSVPWSSRSGWCASGAAPQPAPSGRGAPSVGRSPGVLDGRLFAPVMLVGALLATVAMEHALVTHDFSIVFVAENNSKVTPLLYSLTGLWSALAGSILLWGLVLTIFSGVFVWRYRRLVADPVIRWATLVLYVVTAFFFGMMVGPANPFVTTPDVTAGLGPNSLLQDNPLVAIHPPLLYIGFVGFTVPFAFAIGMLATGRISDRWQIECRRWTLFSFTSLSVGIVLGAWWSYQVLGWGGFWGWDPVENAALLPWLCGTAYLHSVLVQERRGLMRVWNLSLSVATFALTILGTFLTRSGVINSVHAFSESTLGPILISFFFVVVIVGFGLIAWRGDRLRSPGGIDAPLGREGAFLLNNLLFVGFAFVVLLGTLYPLLYEAVTQQQVNVGAPFFNTIAIPFGLSLLFLMAVAPALSWRKINGAGPVAPPRHPGLDRGPHRRRSASSSGCVASPPWSGSASGRSRPPRRRARLVLSVRATRGHHVGWWRGLIGRTNGGMVVHLGVIVMAVGIIAATTYRQQTELALAQGQS